jgi:hypothetical protein
MDDLAAAGAEALDYFLFKLFFRFMLAITLRVE